MTLDELVQQRFLSVEYFSKTLAKYGEYPAIFYQSVPDDVQSDWKGTQYPRIVYTIDMQADQERKTAGVMQVDLYCDEEKNVPEEIEPYIRDCLENLIMKPEGKSHYAFAWARTEMFTIEQGNNNRVRTRVIGATLRFDILEYSLQETTNPDPVKALSRWLKEIEPEILVIGEDTVDMFYEPSGERPAIYVRALSHKTNRTTYALSWIDCTLSVHVIAPEPESRNLWVRYLADCLNIAGEIAMLDGSVMLLHEVLIDNITDYLMRGQIAINAEYSLPRMPRVEHPLNHMRRN